MDDYGRYGAPAVVVEKIKQDGRWIKGPVVVNHQGHWDTEAILWGREPVPGDGPETYRQTINYLYGIIDKANPADSARYVNTGSVFTEDPELGKNFGTYRCEIKGPRRLGVNPEPGQTG